MFEVSINGEKVEAEVSFLTAVLYESEFGKDMIQDFFGDILKMGDQVVLDEDLNVVSIDFERINWMAANRVLWAAIKTADDSAPGYRKWAKQTKGVDMWGIRDELAGEVSDCFFRPSLAQEEAGEEG